MKQSFKGLFYYTEYLTFIQLFCIIKSLSFLRKRGGIVIMKVISVLFPILLFSNIGSSEELKIEKQIEEALKAIDNGNVIPAISFLLKEPRKMSCHMINLFLVIYLQDMVINLFNLLGVCF